MNTQTSVQIPENISLALNLLLPEQRQQVYDFVEFLVHRQQTTNSLHQEIESIEPSRSTTERILGLHQGKGSVSDDFTNPLPDGFWDVD